MDNMMGGEGSERLAAMHRRMGYNYLAGEESYNGMMDWGRRGSMMGPGMMGGEIMGGFGIIFWVLIVAGVVFLAIYGFRKTSTADHGGIQSGPDDPVIDILKNRYARGEINREEYEQMKRDIL